MGIIVYGKLFEVFRLSMDDVRENESIELSTPDSSAVASKANTDIGPDLESLSELDDEIDLSELSQEQPAQANNGAIVNAEDEKTIRITSELPKIEPTGKANEMEVRVNSEREGELVTLNGLLLVVLAGAMFYVGTVVFASDSLLFFGGIFVYVLVAPPGTYAQGKSKMVSFTKEVAIAFALCFCLFMLLKTFLPPDADQAKLLTILLTVLGVKLVFYPYYNFKQDD